MTSWPGYGVPAYGHAAMLASDADRDRAAEVLKSGFAAGRLTKDEYDAHLHWVYTARTHGDLVQVTGQLPGGGMALFAAPAPRRTNPLAQASLACGLAVIFLGLTSIPAVMLGHRARRQIRQTGEAGDALALTGLTLGWIGVTLWVLFWCVTLAVGMAVAHGAPMHATPFGPHQFVRHAVPG